MTQIEAVYRRGVFEPLEPVSLQEEQRVRLRIDPAPQDMQTWLRQVQALQSAIVQRQGHLPDSTPDVAADRLR